VIRLTPNVQACVSLIATRVCAEGTVVLVQSSCWEDASECTAATG